MSLLDFFYVAAASWLVLSAIGLTSWCALIALHTRRPPSVLIAQYPPPVPAPRARPESDAHWLDLWPIPQEQVDRRFAEQIAMEGLQ